MLTEVDNIRYKGNDAIHELVGQESDARLALETCKKVKSWYEANKNEIEKIIKNNELTEGKTYLGEIKKYGNKRFGFIVEENTGQEVFLSAEEQDYVNPSTIKKGYKVIFEVVITSKRIKYEAKNMKIIGQVKNIDAKGKHKYGFLDVGSQPDIYFSFNRLSDKQRQQISEGSKLAFKLKRGSKKDEAYDIAII